MPTKNKIDQKPKNPQFQIFEPQTKTKPEVTHSHLN